MVADGIHILLAVSLIVVLLRTDRVEAYLLGILAAGLPDLDRYLLSPLVYGGYLSGPIWTHRGITHSLFAMVLVVGMARLAGLMWPAAIGYGSHLIADFATGSIRLFAPFSVRPYGLYLDWGLGNVVAGAVATLIILAELAGRLRAGDHRDDAEGRIDSVAHHAGVRIWRRFR